MVIASSSLTTIKIKRAYGPKENADGFRILVDGLWPRGIKKEDLKIDIWLKEIAPSAELRKWFNHDVERWKQFKTATGCLRYLRFSNFIH